jgi:hypothetical protein
MQGYKRREWYYRRAFIVHSDVVPLAQMPNREAWSRGPHHELTQVLNRRLD